MPFDLLLHYHHQEGIKFAFDNMKRQMPYAMLSDRERRSFFYTAPRAGYFVSRIMSQQHPSSEDVDSLRNVFADVFIGHDD